VLTSKNKNKQNNNGLLVWWNWNFKMFCVAEQNFVWIQNDLLCIHYMKVSAPENENECQFKSEKSKSESKSKI